MLEGSDDEAQSDAIVSQVLDEIGIEITGKMINAPTPSRGGLVASKANAKNDDDMVSDAEIQDMLAKLKA